MLFFKRFKRKSPTVRALIEIRTLLEDPQRWTRGSDARDASGRSVRAHSPAAVKWCLQGAQIKLAQHNDEVITALRNSVRKSRVANPRAASLTSFNDSHSTTHADILDVIDAAIREA